MAYPGPYSGKSTFAQVARVTAAILGLTYGSIKIKYLRQELSKRQQQKHIIEMAITEKDQSIEMSATKQDHIIEMATTKKDCRIFCLL
ncbi:hypothetical protein KP509_30G001900 [Ceratopteris richardii]|uniref:ATP synthase subunit e, mitochondrial n=1 Tax=Ceratopteris richardii TaxID=49495 RepID=A0A8T2R1K4_CERRI|nr:hypothetical protein KP509_30G001900 [Ceratopteris richardii]